MILKKEIFREYDIRGIYGEEMDDETAYHIGRAYATKLLEYGKDSAVVGYDNRLSSPNLAKHLIKGLLDSGINVINLGLVTTPMCYFAANHYKVNAFQAYPPFYINEDFWLKINSIHMNLIKDLYSIIKSLPSVPFNLATGLCYAALYKECSFYLGKMKDSQSVSSDEGFCFHMRKESDEFGYFPDTIYLPTTALQLVQFDDYKYDFCINRIKSTIILIRKEIEDIIKL